MGEEAEITELRLGPPRGSSVDSDGGKSKKRAFMETVENESSTTEEGERVGVTRAAAAAKEEEEPAAKGRVVGWPPVCAYRQRNGGGGGRRVYVKVSMDGAPFLRKLELDACRGYGDLTVAVEALFAIRGSEGGEYTQIYEDKDGDWMLVGDVPWEMFMESCKRLRLMKSSEARGFGLQLRAPSEEVIKKM